LDDFYRDRSHLKAEQRNKINFDHPRAIDWRNVEIVLHKLASGKTASPPKYNFATHTRLTKSRFIKPKPIIIMDGLWLLRRPSLRKLFSCRIFIDCPRQLRLKRRLNRDLEQRGRDLANTRKQFWGQVVPMHDRFVAPQIRRANFVVSRLSARDVTSLAGKIKTILNSN
jgi:uridine kinase